MATTLQITPIDGEDASTEAPSIALTPAYKWLGQVLYGDQLEDSVYLLTDLNADGDAADAGEHNVFFNGANASGLVNPTTNVFDVFQASNGAVYVAEGDTDSVYRVRDLNGDGDGNDAGEANVWFSAAGNAGAFTLPTPNGVAQGADGAIYFVNAGVGSAPADRVYRTVDLNADGDANDAGEATVFVDLQTLISTSSAFDISFIGNVAYVTDTNGGAPDTVYRLEDQNGDGDASDVGEATVFLSETNSFGAPMDIANAPQGNSLLTYTWIGNAGDPSRIYRLTDLNGSKTIDSAAEAVEVWNWNFLPDGFAASVGFSITSDGDDIVITSNGDPNERNVIRLTDLNADGDYKDEGEQIIALSNAIDAGTAGRPRAVSYYSDGTVIAHPLTYKEGGDGVVFARDLAITDADSTTFSGAEIKIVGGFADGDTLVFALPDGSEIQGEYDAENGVLILAGAGSVEDYQAIIRSITFEARVDDPSGDLRHISITVYDERGLAGSSVTVSTTLDTEIDPDFVTHFGSDGEDAIEGGAGSDRFISFGGDDELNGGGGYDIAKGGSDLSFTATATGWTVESTDGTDTLTDIEKVVDAEGNPTWLNKPGELAEGGSNSSIVKLDEAVNIADLAEAGWTDQGGGIYGKAGDFGIATLNTNTLTVSYLLLQSLLNPLAAGEFVQEVLTIPLAGGNGHVRFAIAGANDAPELTGDLSASIDAGATYTIAATDLNFTDVDDVAADVTFTVSNAVHGSVKVDGVVQSTFTGAHLAAGLVSFEHDGSGNASASFDVSVEDGNEDVSSPDSDIFDFTVSFGAPAADVVGTKAGDNPLDGTIGSETIFGLTGNDTIHAGVGDDIVVGGRGYDTLFGEGGADRFDFNSIRDSLRGAAHDVVMDFEHGLDVIDLSGIDANSHRRGNQTFTFIEGNFTGKAGQLHVAAKGGDLYRVEGDVNGDGKADFKIDVHSAVALDIGDFIR